MLDSAVVFCSPSCFLEELYFLAIVIRVKMNKLVFMTLPIVITLLQEYRLPYGCNRNFEQQGRRVIRALPFASRIKGNGLKNVGIKGNSA